MGSRPSFEKRRKEQKRKEKQHAKQARRAEAAARDDDKAKPDDAIAHIVPGPQPTVIQMEIEAMDEEEP
ncbi:MAG: hypothetical protein R3B13_20425 [Polyangiaceae bacterium]